MISYPQPSLVLPLRGPMLKKCYPKTYLRSAFYFYSITLKVYLKHDNVIKWKHFPRYWPFVRGIHRSLVNSLTKASDAELLMLSLICAWMNGWVNTRKAGDLRRHRAHYDATVMEIDNTLIWNTTHYSWLKQLLNVFYHLLPEASFGLRALLLPASVCDNSGPVQARISKFGPKMQNTLLKEGGIDF